MPSFTTTELLQDIKQKAFVPTSQVTFTDSQLLTMADDELRMRLMPLILGVREDYYLTYYDYTIAGSQNNYDVPTRALGGKIKDIFNIVNTQVFPIPFLPLHLQSQDYIPAPRNLYFSFQDNQVVLYNPSQQSQTGTLRLYYYRRPGNLVLAEQGGQITNIDTINNQITVDSAPTTFTVGTLIDIQNPNPHFQYRGLDMQILAVSSNTLTFTSLPSGLQVGDWVTLAGESVVVQVPVEFQALLAHYVSAHILESLGALEEVAIAEKSIKSAEEALVRLISPRADAVAKKIVAIRGVLPGVRRGPYYYY